MNKTNGSEKRHPILAAFGVLIFVVAIIMCIRSGIMNLVGAGDAELFSNAPLRAHVSGEVMFATKMCEYKHTLNGLIPIGTEHYYFVIDKNGENYCVVRAKKSWYEENFDSDGFATQGVEITGIVTKVASGLESTFNEFNAENAELGIKISTENFVDILGYRFAWENVIAGVLFILGLMIVFWQYYSADRNKVIGNIGMLTILAASVMLVRFFIFS